MAAQQLLDLQEDQLVTFEKVYEDEIHIFEVSHHVIPLKNETEEIIKVVFFVISRPKKTGKTNP